VPGRAVVPRRGCHRTERSRRRPRCSRAGGRQDSVGSIPAAGSAPPSPQPASRRTRARRARKRWWRARGRLTNGRCGRRPATSYPRTLSPRAAG